MRVAYLINEYPKVTHTFVRTEIAAVERAGVIVDRIAMRRSASPLLDDADRLEAQRTRIVLDGGALSIGRVTLHTLLTQPRRFWRALRTALRLGWGSDRGALIHLAYLAEACVVLRWVTENQVDHVHAVFGANPATVALLCRVLGGPPFSFTAHGPEEFDRSQALRIPEKAEQAAFVVAVSHAGRAQLQERCSPAVQNRIHVVRCGIDERFRRVPATPVPTARRLVYVGRLAPEKSPLQLIDTVADLRDAGEPCELTLVGDGPLRTAVQARIAARGLAAEVTLVGWGNPDLVQRQILAARALVLPSTAEGLPIVLMEALALHRPVVCTQVGGVTELVESGVSGWVVPADAPVALADAIRNVLNAPPEELDSMANHGAARVAQQHDALASGRALAQLFAASVSVPQN